MSSTVQAKLNNRIIFLTGWRIWRLGVLPDQSRKWSSLASSPRGTCWSIWDPVWSRVGSKAGDSCMSTGSCDPSNMYRIIDETVKVYEEAMSEQVITYLQNKTPPIAQKLKGCIEKQ